ncbi:MAG: CerR family C-terminal domain-containing protein [Planctomycetota bacterium]
MATADKPLKQQILDVALELFAKQGYKETSLRDIAERAGVSHSSIQYHFGTKQSLYREALKQVDPATLEGAFPPVPKASEMTPEEAIELLHEWVLTAATLKARIGPSHHTALSQLEGGTLGQPPDPAFYRKVIHPGHEALKRLISAIRPDITDTRTLEVLGINIIAQCVMLREKRGIVQKRLKVRSISRQDAEFIARCITDVAVRGIQALDL